MDNLNAIKSNQIFLSFEIEQISHTMCQGTLYKITIAYDNYCQRCICQLLAAIIDE